MINESNQALESQSANNKNLQSTTQSIQHDDGDIDIDFPIKKSKRPTNYFFPSKRRQASTCKWQVVKWAQEQLQAYGQPIKPVATMKLSEVLSKPMRLHLIDDNDLDVQVAHESVKEISAKKLVFGASSIKLRTVLQILQESDPLAQEKRPMVANIVQEQK